VPATAPPLVPAPITGLFAVPTPAAPATGTGIVPALPDGESSSEPSLQPRAAAAEATVNASSANGATNGVINLAMSIDSLAEPSFRVAERFSAESNGLSAGELLSMTPARANWIAP
jgi:hypothetical protein